MWQPRCVTLALPPSLPTLSLGELVRASGVALPTIIEWQSRLGFPETIRDQRGATCFDVETVRLVQEVWAAVSAGVPLESAVADVVHSDEPWRPCEPSIYTAVRESVIDVTVRTLTKRTLLGVAWAIEDECIPHAHRPILVGAFQHGRFFARARKRWSDFASEARSTLVFTADTPDVEVAGIKQVALPAGSPILREWAVVCDAVDRSAVLTAWELPGQDGVPDLEREFEAVWTLDPATARRASRAAVEIAVAADTPGAAALMDELRGPVVVAPPASGVVERFHQRVVTYVDRLNR